MAKRRSGVASARDNRMLAAIGAALIGLASAPTGRAAEPIWAAQFGTFTDEFALATHVDAKGNVITCGETLGDLFAPNAGRGETDAWVAKHSSTGTMIWGQQFGSAYGDVCYGASTDAAGNVCRRHDLSMDRWRALAGGVGYQVRRTWTAALAQEP